MDESNPIKTDAELSRDFNKAASPQPEIAADFPMPELKLNPPRLPGPSLGGISLDAPEQTSVIPAARDPDPTKPALDQEARGGSFRAMFNRKARERGDEFDLGH